jgi:hypothetical protein
MGDFQPTQFGSPPIEFAKNAEIIRMAIEDYVNARKNFPIIWFG